MEFRPIDGYEGYYEISDCGYVKSLARTNIDRRGFPRFTAERILRNDYDRNGYPIIHLCKKAKFRTLQIHRLVAKAFIPLVEGKDIINHIDGNPNNNNVANLEWCTASENMLHANRTGLRKSCTGAKNPNSKLTDERAQEIVDIYNATRGSISKRGIAKLFPEVSVSVVLNIINGKKWPHLKRPYLEQSK